MTRIQIYILVVTLLPKYFYQEIPYILVPLNLDPYDFRIDQRQRSNCLLFEGKFLMIVVWLSRWVGIEYKSYRDDEVKNESDKERYDKTEPSGVIFVDVLGEISKFNLFL